MNRAQAIHVMEVSGLSLPLIYRKPNSIAHFHHLSEFLIVDGLLGFVLVA